MGWTVASGWFRMPPGLFDGLCHSCCFWACQLKRLQLRNPGCEGDGMLSAAFLSQKETHPTSLHHELLKNKRSQHGRRALWACGRATENEGAPSLWVTGRRGAGKTRNEGDLPTKLGFTVGRQSGGKEGNLLSTNLCRTTVATR